MSQQNQGQEAIRVLAAIAIIEANSNSEPDVMGEALDSAISDAQAFFRLSNLCITDYIGAIKPSGGAL